MRLLPLGLQLMRQGAYTPHIAKGGQPSSELLSKAADERVTWLDLHRPAKFLPTPKESAQIVQSQLRQHTIKIVCFLPLSSVNRLLSKGALDARPNLTQTRHLQNLLVQVRNLFNERSNVLEADKGRAEILPTREALHFDTVCCELLVNAELAAELLE